MSGIYIPGMEMPKTGRYFVAVDNTDGKDKTVISVMSEFERGDKTRPLLAVCEIIPVPDHGRIIDADALWDVAYKAWGTEYDPWVCNLFMEMINNAPTIIPADKEGTAQ